MRRQSAIAVFVAASFLFVAAPGAAATCNSVAACVLGNNTGAGVGLEGVSQQNVGLYGVSTSNHGIDGRSRQSYGVVGYTYATDAAGEAGVYGIDAAIASSTAPDRNAGVLGSSSNGIGVRGTSSNGIGVEANGSEGLSAFGTSRGARLSGDAYGADVLNDSTVTPTLLVANYGPGFLFEAESFDAGNNVFNPVASIDSAGNELLAGTLTENGTPLLRTRTSVKGADVTSYGDRTTLPTLEDFGSARLRDGVAFVALEARFASTIDARSYMVFVTPHGDSNSLYTVVAHDGFTVRESKGGHSTLAFDYRIVAKPLDANLERLPAMAPPKRASSSSELKCVIKERRIDRLSC